MRRRHHAMGPVDDGHLRVDWPQRDVRLRRAVLHADEVCLAVVVARERRRTERVQHVQLGLPPVLLAVFGRQRGTVQQRGDVRAAQLHEQCVSCDRHGVRRHQLGARRLHQRQSQVQLVARHRLLPDAWRRLLRRLLAGVRAHWQCFVGVLRFGAQQRSVLLGDRLSGSVHQHGPAWLSAVRVDNDPVVDAAELAYVLASWHDVLLVNVSNRHRQHWQAVWQRLRTAWRARQSTDWAVLPVERRVRQHTAHSDVDAHPHRAS